jgi:hypothetical protein
MTAAAIQIDYAGETEESPADRLLRRIVGWAAVVYGGAGVLRLAIHIALARGWVSRPPNMSWSLSAGWGALLVAAQTLTDCGFLLAGALLLRRSFVGVPVLRGAAAVSAVMMFAHVVYAMFEFQNYASYWSKPASAAVQALDLVTGLWVPLLIAALTFRPPGKRLA